MVRDAERIGALSLGGGVFSAPPPPQQPAAPGVSRRADLMKSATQGLVQTPTASIVARTSVPLVSPRLAAAVLSVAPQANPGMSFVRTMETAPAPGTVTATPVTGGGPSVRVPVPTPLAAPPPSSSSQPQCPPGQYWSGYACLDNGSTSSLLPAGFSGGSGGGITTAPPAARGMPAFGSDGADDSGPAPGGSTTPNLVAAAPASSSRTTVIVVAGVGAAALAVGLGVLLARGSRKRERS